MHVLMCLVHVNHDYYIIILIIVYLGCTPVHLIEAGLLASLPPLAVKYKHNNMQLAISISYTVYYIIYKYIYIYIYIYIYPKTYED